MNDFTSAIVACIDWIQRRSAPTMKIVRQPTQPPPNDVCLGHVTVVENASIQKWATFQCPGACGERILLNLSPSKKPRWTVSHDWLKRPTIKPSVRQTNHCRCHFWVTKGRIDWCADSPNGPKT